MYFVRCLPEFLKTSEGRNTRRRKADEAPSARRRQLPVGHCGGPPPHAIGGRIGGRIPEKGPEETDPPQVRNQVFPGNWPTWGTHTRGLPHTHILGAVWAHSGRLLGHMLREHTPGTRAGHALRARPRGIYSRRALGAQFCDIHPALLRRSCWPTPARLLRNKTRRLQAFSSNSEAWKTAWSPESAPEERAPRVPRAHANSAPLGL